MFAQLKSEEDRYYYFVQLIRRFYPLFISLHFSFVFLFSYLGIRELVVFNIFSVSLYAYCFYLNKRQQYFYSYALCTIEVLTHAAFCSVLIGNTGFSDAVIFLPVLFFLYPVAKRIKFAYAAGIALFYVCLSYYEQVFLPLYTLDATLIRGLNIGTNFLITLIASCLALYFHNTIFQKEEELKQENGKLLTQYEIVKKLSITDPLTQLFNRIKIENTFKNEISRASRNNNGFSVVLLDLDGFKLINDTYGHNIGDVVLKRTAEVLRSVSRDIDIVGRWGGEEFIIIAPDTDLDGALNFSEKIRSTLERTDMGIVGVVTASFGVTSYRLGDTIETIVNRADTALYSAKNAGRNRAKSQ